jgi:nicotinamide mononucleotide transporter
MSVIDNLTILLVIASLVATYLNVKKKKVCFKIWTVTNTLWAMYDLWKGAYWQSVLFGVYVILAIMGMVEWRKK